jgi:uncharacterized protein (DUF885 family)
MRRLSKDTGKQTMSYRGLSAIIALLLAFAGCSSDPEPTPEAQAARQPGAVEVSEFRAFLDANYALDMVQFPATATRRGILDNNDRWNNYSEAFAEQRRQLGEERLAALQQFDPASLGDGEALSWRLYRSDLERGIAADAFRHHHYVIHQHRGPHTLVPSFLINNHKVRTVQQAEDYIARLRAVATLFDQVIEQLDIRDEAGIFLPDWSYPRIIETSMNTIRGAPFEEGEDSALWADFKSKVAALEIAEAEQQALLQRARAALVESLAPAYLRLIAALEQQAAGAPAADGAWKHPDGDAFYGERLAYYTTTDLTPEQVHQLGLREVARVHEEMRGIMKKVGFEGDLKAFMQFMREDPGFYYGNDEAGRERYLAEATAYIDTMRERLPDYFGLLPKADIIVKRVEPFRERAAGKAFYQAPPKDGSRPGIYYANLYDMNSMPVYQMEALAYHEGIPGHHMQRAISIEKTDIPEFQKYARFTAFTEGWALYTEQLAKEMGFYADPYADFGRLAMELWRAARLVVDTGLHYKRWTREEAIQYLVDNTPNSRYDATKAIERYAAMPGQATAYMIGKLKILELRKAAREALGEQFDIRGFHDEVLRDGPVPLSILEDKINRWVARQSG